MEGFSKPGKEDGYGLLSLQNYDKSGCSSNMVHEISLTGARGDK